MEKVGREKALGLDGEEDNGEECNATKRIMRGAPIKTGSTTSTASGTMIVNEDDDDTDAYDDGTMVKHESDSDEDYDNGTMIVNDDSPCKFLFDVLPLIFLCSVFTCLFLYVFVMYL